MLDFIGDSVLWLLCFALPLFCCLCFVCFGLGVRGLPGDIFDLPHMLQMFENDEKDGDLFSTILCTV